MIYLFGVVVLGKGANGILMTPSQTLGTDVGFGFKYKARSLYNWVSPDQGVLLPTFSTASSRL